LYALEKESDLWKKIKASDLCCLPPCQRVLQQKLLRTNFVAYVWKHTRESKPVAFGPDGDGWELDDRRLKIVWFTSQNAPTNFATEELNLEDETDDETDAEETSSHEDEEEMDDN